MILRFMTDVEFSMWVDVNTLNSQIEVQRLLFVIKVANILLFCDR
jgi:hypothetical protein